MTVPETAEEAFVRGQVQGQVKARLDNHEARLGAHDIAIAAIGPQMVSLTTSFQELRADLRGRDDTAKALIAADDRRRRELDENDENRRKRADEAREALAIEDEQRAKVAARKFLPITKALAYATGIEGLILAYAAFMSARGKG